jgi:hypothetical protein
MLQYDEGFVKVVLQPGLTERSETEHPHSVCNENLFCLFGKVEFYVTAPESGERAHTPENVEAAH